MAHTHYARIYVVFCIHTQFIFTRVCMRAEGDCWRHFSRPICLCVRVRVCVYALLLYITFSNHTTQLYFYTQKRITPCTEITCSPTHPLDYSTTCLLTHLPTADTLTRAIGYVFMCAPTRTRAHINTCPIVCAWAGSLLDAVGDTYGGAYSRGGRGPFLSPH